MGTPLFMLKKGFLLLFLLSLFTQVSKAQDCQFKLKGYVLDEVSETPLSYVNVFVQETYKGAVTDEKGYFEIDGICAGEYHITFSHIGCEPEKYHFDIEQDTSINVLLGHTPTSFGTIVVEAKKDEFNNQPSTSVGRKQIEDNAEESLAGLLKNETGVSLIKNGSGISKPVVQGLYGNRLSILNNGITQSGQQWGNDHSPEIDPFIADKISVIKGVSSVEYAGGNLGAIVLVEPKRIEREPHLHGQVNYVFESNGQGHVVNTRLGKYSEKLAWRLNGTYKNYGDRQTPTYFLNNTGIREYSLALQLEKEWDDRLFFDFYASSFNTEIGVLRGSHISNLTDLENAFGREEPFFTEEEFSSAIEAPKQEVSHHLAKAKIKYFLNENDFIEYLVAGQLNDRNEFDIRRGGRTERPALSLLQFTFNSELKVNKSLPDSWNLRLGLQNVYIDNENNPVTGILPLIPDYYSWNNGIYTTLSKTTELFRFDIGVRYDYNTQNAATISQSIPREIIRFENDYHNLNALFGLKINFNKAHALNIGAGFAMRNPAINELYSAGLHQGVSGIEEGDVDLNTERLFKQILQYKWLPNSNFSLDLLAYHQYFRDYIYLEPSDVLRLTIRGAFPVFTYQQTDASIFGLDLSSRITISDSFLAVMNYSFLRGTDLSNSEPLIFMPPNSFFGSLVYRMRTPKDLSETVKLEDLEIELSNRYIFEQKNILPEQDFLAPPAAYNLIGIKLSADFQLPNYKLRAFVKTNNLFNVAYRDYLNRQRYFSDELGRSLLIGVNFKF